MNNTVITLILVVSGAVIALVGCAFGVWIVAKLTGAFNTATPFQVPDIPVINPHDLSDGIADVVERVPWEDEPEAPDGDPGDDPSLWTEAPN